MKKDRYLKKLLVLNIILALVIGMFPSVVSRAASIPEWKAAYKKTVKDYYKNYTDTKDVFIDDMDKDGIPELFCVSNHTVSYFSYNNKKTNVIAAYEVNGGYLSVRFYSGQHYTMVVDSIFDTVYAFSKDGTLFYTTPEYLSDGGVEYVLKTEDGKVLAKGEEKINKYVKEYGYEFSKKDTPSPYLHAQGKYKEIIGANKGETNGNTIKLAATLNEALDYITKYEFEYDPLDQDLVEVSKLDIASIPDVTYTGSAIKPFISVKYGNAILKEGTDYSLKFSNNTKVGTASVTITGMGRYEGSVTKTFKIVKDDTANADVSYRTYVQSYGWQPYVKDGSVSGTYAHSKRLEGLQIKLSKKDVTGGITYRTYVQKLGWQAWAKDGAYSGTKGQGLRLESFQAKLTGKMAQNYDVYYRVQAQKFGWMGWAKNGATAGTAGYGYRLEAVQIKLVKKGAKGPTSSKAAFQKKG